jgi:hypothetical protein
MPRKSNLPRKKPMGTVTTAPSGTRARVRKNARASDAEERFVNELMRITRPMLQRLPASELDERLEKLRSYLASLDGESDAKRV